MRLFVALDPPAPVPKRCAALQEVLDLDARWTDPDQFHVTLRFIGDVDPEQATRYGEALTTVTAPPVPCVPYGLDALPSRQNPRVLVVGLERTDALLALYEAVSDALATEGLEPEDRTYRPHVTLARLDDAEPSVVHEALTAHEAAVEPFTAQAFHLYESTLMPDGAIHERRASYPLSG